MRKCEKVKEGQRKSEKVRNRHGGARDPRADSLATGSGSRSRIPPHSYVLTFVYLFLLFPIVSYNFLELSHTFLLLVLQLSRLSLPSLPFPTFSDKSEKVGKGREGRESRESRRKLEKVRES